MYCLQQQYDSRCVGASPLFSGFVFFFLFLFRLLLLLLLVIFSSLHTQNIPVFGFASYQTCGVPFRFGRFSKPENSKKISRFPPSNLKYVVQCNT